MVSRSETSEFIDVSTSDLRADFALGAEQSAYVDYHRLRYSALLDAVAAALDDRTADPAHLVDVGPGVQTELVRRRFTGIRVSTLGFAYHLTPLSGEERHLEFDLNRAQSEDQWLPPADFDGLLMAEVLEHLYTAPSLVLGMLKRLVRPGGFLVVQTPNACSLASRIRMLAGRSPFEEIREDAGNPGHFHEYTMRELTDVGERLGLAVERAVADSYFLSKGRLDRLCRRASPVLPASLQEGFTVTFTV